MLSSTQISRQIRDPAVWLSAALILLTLDVAAGGQVVRLEERYCRAPGPAPAWARYASRAVERETLVLVAVTAAVHRWSKGQPVAPPVWRLAGGVLARALFARTVGRPRPPRSWWRAEPHGSSFPSRHTTHALLAAAVLSAEVVPNHGTLRGAGVAAVTGVVGASRLRMGVHWPSDVLGGVLVGALWLRITGTRSTTSRR